MRKTGDVKTEKEAKTSNVKYITLNIKCIISTMLESNLLKTEQSGERSCLSVLSRPIQHWPQRWTAAKRANSLATHENYRRRAGTGNHRRQASMGC
jgi:hypothetical protein